MARILVIFGMTDGQTANVALAIEGRLRRHGHHVAVNDVALEQPSPADYDAVIVAASEHAGHCQSDVVDWVSAHSAILNGMPTAFMSVDVGESRQMSLAEGEPCQAVQNLIATTGWHPGQTETVASTWEAVGLFADRFDAELPKAVSAVA